MTTPSRPAPPPLEVDDWRLVGAGVLLWAVAFAVLGVADLAGASVPGWWLWMCGVGVALGLVGVRIVRRRATRGVNRPQEGNPPRI
jgi:hypothetical protein